MKKECDMNFKELTIEKSLRSGNFGATVLARRGVEYLVLKEIAVSNIDVLRMRTLENEINLIRKLDVFELVKLVDISKAKIPKTSLYFSWEYCSGGNLHAKLAKARANGQNFSEFQIMAWFFNIAQAVAYLHAENITHGLINSYNVLFEDATCSFVKLGDYGLSKVREICKVPTDCSDDPSTKLCYQAPEALKGHVVAKSDIWSCGVLLYEMSNLSLPFSASSRSELIKQMKQIPSKSLPRHFSVEFHDLVCRMLSFSAASRPSAGCVLTDDCVVNSVLNMMDQDLAANERRQGPSKRPRLVLQQSDENIVEQI